MNRQSQVTGRRAHAFLQQLLNGSDRSLYGHRGGVRLSKMCAHSHCNNVHHK